MTAENIEYQRKDDIMIEQLQKEFNTHREHEATLMASLKTDIDEIKKNTEDLVQFWSDAKGFIAIMKIFGKIIKWGTPIVAGLAAAYYAITGGK